MNSPSRAPQVLAHCPMCQVLYPDEGVQMLNQRGASRLFHCTCATCGNAIMAMVMEGDGGVSSVGLVTDLEIQDARRVQNVPSISADDCVAFHASMKLDSQALITALLDKRR